MLITVLTHPRPNNTSYVQATVSSLLAAGASCVVVINDDPRTKLPQKNKTTYVEIPPSSNLEATWAVFDYFTKTEEQNLLFCEDDVVFSKNAIKYVTHLDVPKQSAFITFHDATEFVSGAPQGMFDVAFKNGALRKFIGNQCLLFPRRTVTWLSAQKIKPRFALNSNQADVVIGRLLRDSPWPQYTVHNPALARHIGAVSAAHIGLPLDINGRCPRNYIGDDVDINNVSRT